MQRVTGRGLNQAREIKITPDFSIYAEGSVLIETGMTKVICNASVEDGVPTFLKGKGSGWLSAEYNMLPRATSTRTRRERSKIGGRTQEIQRLIGRSLRSALNLEALGDLTIWIDCDVIQADGGTRTASITGSYVALVLALQKIQNNRKCFKQSPVKHQVAAISLGIVNSEILLDLDYSEDSNADVDMNIIMTDNGNIIEVQGTAEKEPFPRKKLDEMLDLAEKGLRNHFDTQKKALGGKISLEI